MKPQQKGFTLLEVMVVLSIFMTVIGITVISFQPLYRHTQISYFIQQLQLDVAYTQLYSISNQTITYISFLPVQKKYIVHTGNAQNSLITREYSQDIELQFYTLPTTIMFIFNGDIRKSGKMYIKHYNDIYSFVFLFGKGLTYVTKL